MNNTNLSRTSESNEARQWLSIRRAASTMDVSTRFILGEIKAKRLKASRIGKGKHIRISRAEILDYFNRATITDVCRAVAATTEGGAL